MPKHRPTQPASGRAHTHRGRIKAWWRTLGDRRFVALPPPTPSRYTQSDGHADAAVLFGERGIPTNTSFAYWHWQSSRAFDQSGALQGKLLLHWGGDHATVAAGLGSGPDGFQIIDGGPNGAFLLDLVAARDEQGLPDPQDPVGVRQLLERLKDDSRSADARGEAATLSAPEAAWLHDRLAEPLDLTELGGYVHALEWHDALTYDQVSRLLPAWREAYAGQLTRWPGWQPLLRGLLRHDHPDAWNAVTEVRPLSCGLLAELPSERGLSVLRTWALEGENRAIGAWFDVHRTLHGIDPVPTASALAEELTEHDASPAALRQLLDALLAPVVKGGWTGWDAAGASTRARTALALIRFASDARLPRALRGAAAERAYDRVAEVREEAARLGSGYVELTGTSASDALTAVDRYEVVRAELLAGTGPDLTQYERGLCNFWHRYRTLTPADATWLHERLADERTGVQGIAFCLELLYAHGAATEADLMALSTRWTKELTKKYRTTYTEWRHPLVTLTCLAQDLDHPVAAQMLAWWRRAKPLWKDDLRLLTHLGAPTEAKAAELWDFLTSPSRHDTGHLMTWVLLRARLEGVHPLLVAERLIGEPKVKAYVLERVLIGVVDPAQPLWHYAVDPRSRGWWRRATEVADHPDLTPRARAVGVKAARQHHMLRYPDQIRPLPPTEAEMAAARAWLDTHAGTPSC